MRVSLFHNASAGAGASAAAIKELIVREGHVIVHDFDRPDAFAIPPDDPIDVIVAAGGDGTIAAAARLLEGRPIPIAILPLGTANNIAKSVGAFRPWQDVIRGWHDAVSRPFDMGVVRTAHGRRLFLETVGIGLVAEVIASTEAQPLAVAESSSELTAAVERMAEVLARLQPAAWAIAIDGVAASGEFLLVEILNIPAAGPNLVFSPDADPTDSCFDVVVARPQDRAEVRGYLESRLEGREGVLSLPLRSATRVTLRGCGRVHVDDAVVDVEGDVEIGIEPGAVRFLL